MAVTRRFFSSLGQTMGARSRPSFLKRTPCTEGKRTGKDSPYHRALSTRSDGRYLSGIQFGDKNYYSCGADRGASTKSGTRCSDRHEGYFGCKGACPFQSIYDEVPCV